VTALKLANHPGMETQEVAAALDCRGQDTSSMLLPGICCGLIAG